MKHDKLTEDVIIFILTRELEELSQLSSPGIAQKYDVNETDLSKRFKTDTQVSLSDYIEYAQVHRAAELLKEKKDLSIEEIMKSVGIKNKQSFDKKFKEILGVSPTQYMELFKEK